MRRFVQLAVTEPAANAVLHSDCVDFEIQGRMSDATLIVVVGDQGRGRGDPELGVRLGLGMGIITALADSVDFEDTHPGTRVPGGLRPGSTRRRGEAAPRAPSPAQSQNDCHSRCHSRRRIVLPDSNLSQLQTCGPAAPWRGPDAAEAGTATSPALATRSFRMPASRARWENPMVIFSLAARHPPGRGSTRESARLCELFLELTTPASSAPRCVFAYDQAALTA